VKTLDQIRLSQKQEQALYEIRERLFNIFEIEAITLYGSVSRGEADIESDIDLLIVTANPIGRIQRHKITDIVFEINLKFDTNYSTTVVDKTSWEEGIFSILPLKKEILRDGIAL